MYDAASTFGTVVVVVGTRGVRIGHLPPPTLPSYTRLRAVAELLQLQALKPTNMCLITSYSIRPHDYDVGLFGFVFRVFKFY